MNKNEWTRRVNGAIEKSNKERLLQDLHKTESGIKRRKTKTAFVVDCIENSDYKREPLTEIMMCTKQVTKVILTSRFGMLECGRNFKGSQQEICKDCRIVDDESHRLNHCTVFRDMNKCDCDTKIDFQLIFSSDINTLRGIVPEIEKIWNLRNANGTMNI